MSTGEETVLMRAPRYRVRPGAPVVAIFDRFRDPVPVHVGIVESMLAAGWTVSDSTDPPPSAA